MVLVVAQNHKRYDGLMALHDLFLGGQESEDAVPSFRAKFVNPSKLFVVSLCCYSCRGAKFVQP